MGTKFKKQDLRSLLAHYALSGALSLELEAFQTLVADRRRLLGERDQTFRMFDALDTSRRGYLDLRGFQEACADSCRPAALRACEIFHDLDRSRAGAVTVADFEAYLAGTDDGAALRGKASHSTLCQKYPPSLY